MKPIHHVLAFWGLICIAFVGHAMDNNRANVLAPGYVLLDDDTAQQPPVHTNINTKNGTQRIVPTPNARLNYTQIMFEHGQVAGAEAYMVEVAEANTGNLFTHCVLIHKDSSTAVMLQGFEFGKKYIWRYTGLHNNKELGWNGPYPFEILSSPFVDKKLFRATVLQNDTQLNSGGLVLLDVPGTIVDRNGNFVWFFPQPAGNEKSAVETFVNLQNHDMQFTPTGTITSLSGKGAQERDLNGKITWQAPQSNAGAKDTLNPGQPYNYHHCFKKLKNGHYMVLDMEYSILPDSLAKPWREANKNFRRATIKNLVVASEIIKEFDRSGNVVWSWHAKDYVNTVPKPGNLPGVPDSAWLDHSTIGHINAFDVDEDSGFVFAGFRDFNRVIKIDKATGKVVCAWGEGMLYNGEPNADGFFRQQHGAQLLRNHNLAVFNNNFKAGQVDSAVSQVVIFTQPANGINSSIVWKFDCRFEGASNLAKAHGNVDELNNSNLLVNMGAVNRVFEVTRTGQLVWNAMIETFDLRDSAWRKFPVYRAHYTSSLYPCYFSIQVHQPIAAGAHQLKIFNDGSEDDDYIVDITSHAGKRQFSTGTVHTKKSIDYNINADTLPAQVTVTSKTNPAFIRVVDVK